MKMNRIKIVGLCGRSGSGKGYVSKCFAAAGIPAIDTDKVYRDLVECEGEPPSECLAELMHEFGEGILNDSGALNRRALADIVFSPGAGEKLRMLNKITHKYILAEVQRIITVLSSKGCSAVIIDAPVLFESGFDKICDVTVCVTAADEICIERIMSRDSISYAEAFRRLSNQIDAGELRRKCDYEIVNDNVSDVCADVNAFIKKFNLI